MLYITRWRQVTQYRPSSLRRCPAFRYSSRAQSKLSTVTLIFSSLPLATSRPSEQSRTATGSGHGDWLALRKSNRPSLERTPAVRVRTRGDIERRDAETRLRLLLRWRRSTIRGSFNRISCRAATTLHPATRWRHDEGLFYTWSATTCPSSGNILAPNVGKNEDLLRVVHASRRWIRQVNLNCANWVKPLENIKSIKFKISRKAILTWWRRN